MSKRFFCMFLFSAKVMLGFYSTGLGSEEITVAVSSNFAKPAQLISQEFEEQTGHKVKLVFGSSGKLFAQIVNGAPFDVFLSADQDKPQALVDKELALAESFKIYARGRLALVTFEPKIELRDGLVLKTDHQLKIAMGNPRFAPYGFAAMEVLHYLEIPLQGNRQLVYGENISQTYQFVVSRNAQVGIVSLAQVFSGEQMQQQFWIVPQSWYTPINQAGVVIANRSKQDIATVFLEFLSSESIKTQIIQFGYEIPDTLEQK